uniref:Uncharacterized protein n=1 Tax=Avena sativa TaxID=4498 RepID=A0ACD5XEI9_AVESA
MLRLRSSILTHILSYPATSHVPSLHRLISAAVPAISRSPRFAVEDYLVATCGLTPAQAVKASRKLRHLKPPSKPDAVVSFLAGLGLSTADVAAIIAKDPSLLCADVEKTLSSNITGLTGLGFSRSEIARLVLPGRERFRSRSVVSQLQGYLPLFGSSDNLLRAIVFNTNILTYNLETTVKHNLVFLRECGLGACDITKLCVSVPRMLTANTERVRAMLALLDFM